MAIVDGKPLVVGGQANKDGFESDRPGNIELAEPYWKREVNGGTRF